MRTIAAVTTAALLGTASAFVAPTPFARPVARASGRTATQMALSPDDILTGTQNLIAIVKENDIFVKNAGDYAWGSVEAPDWALPVAAISTLSFGVLIPLFLKSGVDSFNAGGAVGAEKKAAATGRPVPTKAAAAKPSIGKPKAAAKPAAGKVVAKGGAKSAAAATPAPKKKSGWF